MSDAAVLWDGIHLTLHKAQRKVINYAVGKYVMQNSGKQALLFLWLLH